MDKLSSLEIQKLLSEYSFLVVDSEYKMNVVDSKRTEFLKMVNEQIGDDKSEETPPNQDEVKPEKEIEVPSEIKNKCKKIYREIVKLTHPDKVESEWLLDLYIKSKKAYEEFNLFELYLIGLKLDINITLEKEDMETLNQTIEKKRGEIDYIESSWIWLWINSETEEDCQTIINNFILKNKDKL